MSLSLEDKKAVVEHVSSALAGAQAAFVADYRGLTVTQMSALRREARETGVFLKVVKNNLARRAVEDTVFACLAEHFVGPTALAASEDPVAAAKLLDKYAKDFEVLTIKVGAMGGSLLSEADTRALAKLPSREELLATLLGTMQAPVATFVRTLNEVPGKFVRTLAALRDQRQAA
ncbi:MAG: 50S ribosomal protein L10 [Arenicellales bacterium]